MVISSSLFFGKNLAHVYTILIKHLIFKKNLLQDPEKHLSHNSGNGKIMYPVYIITISIVWLW